MIQDIPREQRKNPVWLTVLTRVSSTLNRASAVIAVLILVAMITLIMVEIVMRFFSRSTNMTDVLVGQGLAAMTFLSMAWALESSSMIRVNFLRRIATGIWKLILDFIAITSTMVMSGILIAYGWRSMVRNVETGRLSEHYIPIPLWIPEAIFVAGFALLVLQLAVRLGRLLAVGVTYEPDLEL